MIAPEEHKAYDRVCDLIRAGQINPAILRSHVWDGLDRLPEALKAQAAGKVVKGFVRISLAVRS